MAVNDAFATYVLEQLGLVTPTRTRKMFGGVGIWSEELFFALIADDRLYFKVDDSTRTDYEARDMPRFGTMGYYAVPADVLDDPDTLREWVRVAKQVAARTKK